MKTNVCMAVAFLLLCGLFWEYVSPLLIPGSVSDPLDLLAYLAAKCPKARRKGF